MLRGSCARALRTATAVLASTTVIAASAAAQIDQERARAYFAEADSLCRQEGGALWGVSLCGPMVFADPTTGAIASNRPPPDAPRPRALGYANAAMKWGDERWTTVVWQAIPADETARGRLFLHELYHRVQPELGLYVAVSEGAPDHLDTMDGRYWMQLEWRALAAALRSSGVERDKAIRDALAFRAARRALTVGAAERERVIEINEGLAQYTATVTAAATREHAVDDAVAQLERAPEPESFVRTFAYPSGAAYGILLDVASPGWTRRITPRDDLAGLLQSAAGLEPSDAEAAGENYDGRALRIAEAARDVERRARLEELRRRFVDGPVLVVPRGRNASFVTTGVTPIPGAGTVYPQFRVSGEWGSIQAEQVLMSTDGLTLTVPAPFTIADGQISGSGWRVTLSDDWVVRPGPRAGDHEVVRRTR